MVKPTKWDDANTTQTNNNHSNVQTRKQQKDPGQKDSKQLNTQLPLNNNKKQTSGSGNYQNLIGTTKQGLPNPPNKNFCYMNVLVQFLFHESCFKVQIANDDDKTLIAFHSILTSIFKNEGYKESVITDSIKAIGQKHKAFAIGNQCDTMEALYILMGIASNECLTLAKQSSPNNVILEQILKSQKLSQLNAWYKRYYTFIFSDGVCLGCKNKYISISSQALLTINVSNDHLIRFHVTYNFFFAIESEVQKNIVIGNDCYVIKIMADLLDFVSTKHQRILKMKYLILKAKGEGMSRVYNVNAYCCMTIKDIEKEVGRIISLHVIEGTINEINSIMLNNDSTRIIELYYELNDGLATTYILVNQGCRYVDIYNICCLKFYDLVAITSSLPKMIQKDITSVLAIEAVVNKVATMIKIVAHDLSLTTYKVDDKSSTNCFSVHFPFSIRKNREENLDTQEYIETVNEEVILNHISCSTAQTNKSMCSTCKVNISYSKYYVDGPNMIIHIDRTYTDVNKNIKKCQTAVNLPQTYDSFMLSAVICHFSTSTTSGHYIAYKKHKNKWIEFDDMKVKEVAFNTIDNKSIIAALYSK